MVLVLKAWHFFIFAIPTIGNSKNQHVARKIAFGIPKKVHILINP
jgi:hypothetical protein